MKQLMKYWHSLGSSLIDNEKRSDLQFIWIYRILCVVSSVMTVMNIFTQKYALMWATMGFAGLCLLNILLSKCGKRCIKIAKLLLSVEVVALFMFFIVSGTPEGFSAIWICLLPASGLLLYGRERGSILCAVMLAVIVFFFRCPIGVSFLQYEYTESFRTRFAFLYTAFYAVSFLLESIRAGTYRQLVEAKKQYEYLYQHDALTGVSNRYGFNLRMDEYLKKPSGHITLMIVDIDHFKRINDRFGHTNGDIVLKELAAFLSEKADDHTAVCRWGGEEFAILRQTEEDAEAFANELVKGAADMSFLLHEEQVHITVSIGAVSALSDGKIDPSLFVSQADNCLYKAKDSGRNCCVYEKYRKREI